MNKKIFIQSTLLIALSIFLLISCNKEDDLGSSIIEIPETSTDSLDIWIDSTFRVPYNINVEYLWNSSDVDQSKDVVPPDVDIVKPFLKTVLKMWINTYNSVATMDDDFMKNYACRELKLIGSGSYNNGSVTLGLAENGYKITLYMVNSFSINGSSTSSLGLDLREYFRIMHHEFGHILNQRKAYDENFQNISGGYTSDWTSINDTEARELGFISAYARSADTEDFVETLSFYISYSEDEWNSLISDISDEESVNLINEKLQVVASYMKDTYGVNIDELRVAFRTALDEVNQGDLD